MRLPSNGRPTFASWLAAITLLPSVLGALFGVLYQANRAAESERLSFSRLASLGARFSGKRTKCWWYPTREKFIVSGVAIAEAWSMGRNFGDGDVHLLANLPELTHLFLARTEVTDAGLVELGKVTGLEELSLLMFDSEFDFMCDRDPSHLRLTAKSLQVIAGLPNLHSLKIEGYAISDDGMMAIAADRRLSSLEIVNTAVTNVGTKALAEMRNLKCLYLHEVKVGDQGVMPVIESLDRSGGVVAYRHECVQSANWRA